jgi:CHAD domain-containing protein
VKARKVKGVHAEGWLAENARRIVLVRLDELVSFADAARNPKRVRQLHDMRIAAKRLRYLLELHEPVFGPNARRAAKTVRDLQDLLGEIHDCDVMIPLVNDHADALREQDAGAVAEAAGPDSADLDPRALGAATGSHLYRGLESLLAYFTARRTVLHERFVGEWDALERRDFAGKLEWDVERAAEKAMDHAHARERREAEEREALRRAAEERARAAREAEEREAERAAAPQRAVQRERTWGFARAPARAVAGDDSETLPLTRTGSIPPVAAEETPSGGEGNSQE